ncbi:hypothetical protein DPMN_032795 [Dreissena polymorpha]|uniref:Uncharacterized protein n=1 Tax=Dreissena polymorpha TaxID=45954 RepID=A0A9D4RIA5_DREPO|nr:hypothetical protein DPMN_032795 [Dreissena polymorpha]
MSGGPTVQGKESSMEVWRTYSAGQRKALWKSGRPTEQGKESSMEVLKTYSAGQGKLYGSLVDLECRARKDLWKS